MLTIAVCDDEQYFANQLEIKLKGLSTSHIPELIEYQVLPAFSSASEVLDYLTQHTINILFLDIDMPGINGFTLAKQLKEKYSDLLLVFVSSHNELVYDAFFYEPVYFLRKSHLEQDLPTVFEKVIERYLNNAQTMLFQTKDDRIVLQLKDILYLESEHNHYNIYCTNGMVYKCRGTLTSMEIKMQRHGFCRVHSAYLINLANIKQYPSLNAVLMSNGKKILISRRKADDFRKAYSTFTRRRTII